MRKPDFFVVGAPKCGTTSMNFYLQDHPEIFVPNRKEPHFFGSDLSAPNFVRDRERYLDLFSTAKNEKRVGEASVWYLYSRNAATEIKDFNPQASIIIMLRDPVEMMYSLHSHWLYSGNEDIVDFETALEAEEDRKQGRRVADTTRFVEGLFYRDVANYTQQVRRYLDVFGRENVHIIIYDDFKSDTPDAYRTVLRFLGASKNFEPAFRINNSNKQPRNKTLHDLSTNPPKILRRLTRTLAPRPLRQGLSKRLRRYNTKIEPRSPMNVHLSERLRSEFAPEVKSLSELIGRDLTHWSRTETSIQPIRDVHLRSEKDPT